ncbi:hypothetical protein B484DRAFT_31933 [Ochromonadaceae sp. CCMP2298]|nr:hypothetical protein B484DRAFT_31933 [Ochromonadaceae sp. CCMP2298]
MSRLRLANTLPLHVFVHRQQVLRLYRKLLRTARHVEDKGLQKDIRDEIKLEFGKNKDLLDKSSVRTAVQEATRSLTRLEDMTGVTPATPASKKGGSWLDTQDSDDVRGRVGTGWPW